MEVFLSHLLGWERSRLLANSEAEVPVQHLAALQSGWLKIKEGFPVAYLTHEKEFFGHSFYVDEGVLVPRGETELLVEKVLEKADELQAKGLGVLKVLEIGTGSGAIGISLKKANPELEILATDVSPLALEVANKNCVQMGVEIELLESDLLGKVPREEFHILVANLPYIGTETHDLLADNVKAHEPALALFGGGDGLELYSRLFEEIEAEDRSFCFVMGEIGFSQKEDFLNLAAQKMPAYKAQVFQDLQGLDRHFILENQKAVC